MSCRIQHTVTDRQEGAASTHQEPGLNHGQRQNDSKAQTTVAPAGSCHAAQQISSAGKGQAGITTL